MVEAVVAEAVVTEVVAAPQEPAYTAPMIAAAQRSPVFAPATSLASAALEVPAESGLVLVQTRSGAAPLDTEPTPQPRRPRTRRPREQANTENAPLVQVETQTNS